MDLTPPGDEGRPADETPTPPDSRDRIDWDDPADESLLPEAEAPAPTDDEATPASEAEEGQWLDPLYSPPTYPEIEGRRGGGWLTGVLLVVLALGLVAATLWGVWQYRQQAVMQGAALEALGLITAGAPPELAKEMSQIQTYLTSGQADQAAARLATMRAALAGKPGGGPGAEGGGEAIPESAYKDLPPDAAKFFRGHQDLFRQFLLMCARARQLKAEGKNVDALRKVRDRVTEAARLGQLPAVQEGMTQMAQMLGVGPGGGGGEGQQGPLGQKAQRLKRAAERAEEQGRDIRAVYPLMKKAEEAAMAGDMAKAEKYVDQALAAVRAAPRRSGPRRGARSADMRRQMMAAREGRTNPLAPFARALLSVMSAEEANLKIVTDELLKLRQLVLDDKPETPAEPAELSPLIDRALGELKTVAKRRQVLTQRFRNQGNGRAGAPGQLPGQARQRLTPEQRRQMFAILLERLGPILDDIRDLPDTEYQAKRQALVREIVRAVLEPPSTAPPPTTPATPLPTDPEQRVRVKMLEAAKVLAQWELDGKDTAQIEGLFAEARKALYAKQYAEAEKQVDEARKLLGMDQTVPGMGPVPNDSDTIKLNLRARPQ